MFVSVQGLADPLVQSIDGYGFQTSDEFQYLSVNYTYDNSWGDLFWPYGYEPETGQGWNFRAEGSLLERDQFTAESRSFFGGWSRKFSAQRFLSFEMGISHSETEFNNVRQQGITPVGSFKFESHLLDPDLWIRLRAGRERTGSQTLQSQGELGDLYWSHLQPEFLWILHENWRLVYRGDLAWFKDGNRHHNSDAEFLYGFSMDPWIWFGVGGTYSSFSENKSNYYSPRYFHSYGPRGQMSYSFQGGTLVWSLGGGMNWFREEDRNTSTGHYVLTALQYGERDARHLRVYYEDISSRQGGTVWTSRGGGINWVWPF